MNLRRNIWFIYYFSILIGLIYLLASSYSRWLNIKTSSITEIAYLNQLFSSSISIAFDQQEIMLDLLGEELLLDKQYLDHDKSTGKLDYVLQQSGSIIGLGLADIKGNITVGSSNLNLKKMPNLLKNEESRTTFNQALQSNRMILGKTYYLPALEDWVIPIRKSIRDNNKNLLGVMTAGIKPSHLLPKLGTTNNTQISDSYQLSLIHDKSFNYAYISTINDQQLVQKLFSEPIPRDVINYHENAVMEEHNLNFAQLKNSDSSVEYMAKVDLGREKLYSILYLPRHHLWAITSTPKSNLIKEFYNSIVLYICTFIIVFITLYYLFKYFQNFQKKNRKLLLDQANNDFLTGLNNRLFLTYVEGKWINPSADPFYTFFIDLDNFKNINDTHGHSVGDRILKEVADRLRSVFTNDALVCRQGGDEFIILSKTQNASHVEVQAQNALNSIANVFIIGQYQFTIGASIGISKYPDDGESFDSLFSAADTAMYQAKSKKNNFLLYDNLLREKVIYNANVEQALHTALPNNELYVVYQPQIDRVGLCYGVEALLRWEHPLLGNIPPDLFIPVAEDNGHILRVGKFVLDQSIKDISKLCSDKNPDDIHLSINISVRQLQDKGFIDILTQALDKYQFPSRLLTLEITESLFIDDFLFIMPIIENIKSYGIQISLDDFGTGYSSLSMLKNLPIDELKIDKSFIDNIASSEVDASLVRNILDIANNLGMHVVAEGIETQEQSELLSHFCCDIQQGYYHSKPIRLSELTDLCCNSNKTN